MNNTAKILTAVAAGAVAGAVFGILFAPDKGSETRRRINERSRRMADDLKTRFRKGKDQFNDMKEDLEKKFRETAEEFA